MRHFPNRSLPCLWLVHTTFIEKKFEKERGRNKPRPKLKYYDNLHFFWIVGCIAWRVVALQVIANKNVVFSPLSIYVALSLAAGGEKAETLEQYGMRVM